MQLIQFAVRKIKAVNASLLPRVRSAAKPISQSKPATLGAGILFLAAAFTLVGNTQQSARDDGATGQSNEASTLTSEAGLEEASEFAATESSEAQSSEAADTQEQQGVEAAEESQQNSTSGSNSITIDISSSQSTSSEGSTDSESTSESQVTINGEAYELPRNGRIKHETETETDNFESETEVDLDIDIEGSGSFDIRVD